MKRQLRGTVAFAVCGSFCTLGAAVAQAEQLVRQGWELLPVMSYAASGLNTRFGRADEWKDRLETLTGHRVLDTLQDPGNVGTILRTADAFHADGMFLVNGCADLYNPKTLRATMGAVFRCPVWTVGAEELSALLKKSGIPLYGAALREDTLDARAVDYNRCAIAIGSEGRGLTEGVLALCDRTIKIPMSEHCESLNAAAAATVLLWEAARND